MTTTETLTAVAEVRAALGPMAVRALGDAHPRAWSRYRAYRRRGLTVAEAHAGALAWARNVTEQAARRVSHDTGAERRVGSRW